MLLSSLLGSLFKWEAKVTEGKTWKQSARGKQRAGHGDPSPPQGQATWNQAQVSSLIRIRTQTPVSRTQRMQHQITHGSLNGRSVQSDSRCEYVASAAPLLRRPHRTYLMCFSNFISLFSYFFFERRSFGDTLVTWRLDEGISREYRRPVTLPWKGAACEGFE